MKIVTKSVLLMTGVVVISAAVTTGFALYRMRAETYRQASAIQESRLKTFWELLRAKGSAFSLRDGKILAGDYVVNGNYELPDKVRDIFGGTATVFMGDTRVSTNVLKEDGTRAVGTKLQGLAYDAIFKEGKPYRGETLILGVPYFTAYDPIKNREGQTIGVLYVGVKKGEYFAEYDRLRTGVVVMTIVLAAVISAVGGVVIRTSLTPLRSMVATLKDITNGDNDVADLTRRLDDASRDETRDVALGVNNLLAKMQHIVGKLADVTRRMHASSQTIAGAVEQHAGFSAELSASATEISTTMKEFSSTAMLIANHSEQVVGIAGKTLDNTKNGATGVETLTLKLRDISRDNEQSLQEIVELGAKSQQITSIMGIINTIADQTKLIAFNAALEAASAGEAGKRFGVVASEIRRLADSVVESTAEIEAKVTEIVDAVQRLVGTSEKSSRGIEEAVEFSEQTVSMLRGVVNAAQSTTDAARQISLSTQQQQTATAQVVVALTEIQDGTAYSVSAIEEIARISRDLSEVSDDLKKLVEMFRTGA